MTAGRLGAAISKALPYLAFAAVAIGMLNFFWFMSETLPLNLIPSDGRVVDGHYFLWSKTNGGFVEVSRSFWEWVRFHEPTVFLSWPFVMLAIGYLVFAHLSGAAAGQTSPVDSAERVRRVRDSGPLLASTRSEGLIGRAWFSRPLLRIQAYPGGVVVKPPFMAERAVLAREIIAVKPEGGLSAQSVPERRLILGFGVSQVSESYRPRGPFVQIEHAGVGMASPLVISGAGNWDIAQAVGKIADAVRASSEADIPTVARETPMPSSEIDARTIAPVGTTRGGRREPVPPVIKAGLGILGIIVGGWLVWSGITWAIPQLGLFGVVWTAGVVSILAVNAWRFLVRWRE
jgi:hypothetical protein